MRREREHETQIDRTNAISVIKMQREVLFESRNGNLISSRSGRRNQGWVKIAPAGLDRFQLIRRHVLSITLHFPIKLSFNITSN